jgi:hypothetical protein
MKKGDAFTRSLFNVPLEYANGSVQVDREGLKLNSSLQLLVCAYAVNELGRSMHSLKNTFLSSY